MATSGIYGIQSKSKPKKSYVGSSYDVFTRMNKHIYSLKNNNHPNSKLQNHFNKYGISDLQFYIIIECEVEFLLKVEQLFLDSYKPWFNIYTTAGSPLGFKMKEETKEKIRKANTGRKLPPKTEEQIQHMRDGYAGNQYSKVRGRKQYKRK